MAWLSGWGKRRKLTLDSLRVDEDLTDFPVLVTLASGTGKNSADVTSIFDELYTTGIIPTKWNPNDMDTGLSLSNYDMRVTATNTSWKAIRSVDCVSSGKYYWETKIEVGSHNQISIGIGTSAAAITYRVGGDAYGYGYTRNGEKFYNGSGAAYGTTFTAGDIIGIALDLDNGKIWWSKNSVWQASGDPAAGTNPAFTSVSGSFYIMADIYYINHSITLRTDPNALSYTAPTGFTSGFGSTGNISDGMKTMLTTSDGTTPCYVEIERWDAAIEEAYLWAKIPTIVSGTDTDLYLYYDKTQNDNDYYIGDTGETPARNVWDSNFVSVWHMAQDPSMSAVIDSTLNSNNGTSAGSMTTSDLIAGKVGKALDFDGSNDNIGCGSASTLDDIGTITIESTFKAAGWGESSAGRVIGKTTTLNANGYDILIHGASNNRLGFVQGWTTTYGIWWTPNSSVSLSNWYYSAVQYDRSYGTSDKPIVYLNSVLQTMTTAVTPVGSITSDAAQNVCIAARAETDREFEGVIDEVRISDVFRSAAWIKATYYSNWNNFVTFGSEEEEPVYYLDGFVKEYNQPVSRVVKLYKRDTGVLVDSDTSRSSDGYYYLTSSSSGTHFIVAFDDDVGDEFNALILDKVSPKGTV